MPTFRDSVENSILESRLVLAWVVSVEVLVLVDPHLLFFAGFSWGSSGAFFCAVSSEKRLIHIAMYLLVHHVDTITYNQNFLCVQKAVKRIGEQKIFLFSDKPDVASPCCSFFASFFSSCQLQIWFQLLIYNFNTVCFQTWLSNISKYFVWTIQILSKNAKNHFGKTYIKSCFKINFEIYKKIFI